MAIPRSANAATKTWDGGCGADITWSCANNWSDNAVPVAADTVIFDNTSDNNSTVDSATFAGTITTININSGYDGTITLATSLTVSTSFSQAAGSFTAANQTLDVNGTFVTSGTSSFTASSGTMSVSSTFTLGASTTFTHNSGTVSFDGSTSATLTCNSKSLNLVTFAHTGSFTKTVSTGCTMPLGNNPTAGGDATADIQLAQDSVVSGTGTLTIGTAASTNLLTMAGTSNLSGFSGLSAGAMTVSATSTINLGSYTSMTVNGNFTQSGAAVLTVPDNADFNGQFTMSAAANGTFNAAGDMTLADLININSTNTFSSPSGTVTMDGTGSAAMTCAGTVTFSHVAFAHTNGTKTINNGCTVPLGADPTMGTGTTADMSISGAISGTGTFTMADVGTGNNLTLGSTASVSGFDGLHTGDLTVTGATINFSSYTTFIVEDAYTQSAGGTITAPNDAEFNGQFFMSAAAASTFNAPSGTMHAASTFSIGASNTFNDNNGTVDFDGTTGTITCDGTVTFELVTFTHTSNTKIVSSGCSVPLGNDPIVGNDSTADLSVAGTISGTGTLTMGSAATGNLLTLSGTSSMTGFEALNAGSLTISATNTHDYSAYTSFVLGGSYIQSGSSTVTVPDGADFNNNFVLSTGSNAVFNAPAGTMTVAATFAINTGTTFNGNGGTVDLDGTGTGTITCDGTVDFELVTFNHTGSTKTVSSSCTLPLGADPEVGNDTSTGGDITLNGTLAGTGTLQLGPDDSQVNDLTINSGGALSGFSGLVMNGTYTQTGGTINLGSYSPVTFYRNFVLNSGAVFTAPADEMTVANTFTLDAGSTFNANGGTLTFDGGGATLTCNGATFNLVTFTHTSGSKTVSSDCDMPLGNDPSVSTGAGGIILAGEFSGSGTLLMAGGLTLNAGYVLSDFDGLQTVTAKNLTIGGSTTADFSDFTLFDINGDFSMNSTATFTAPTGTMSIASTMNLVSGAVFNANGGTLNFDSDGGSADDGTLTCGSNSFNLVTFTHSSGTKTVQSDCSLPLGANPTAGHGGSITLDGVLSGSGTLTTTGTLDQNNSSGLSGFSGLIATNYNGSATVNFGSYNTFDVNGNFTVESPATFTATSANMTVSGNFTINSGATFAHNNGTVILDGSDQTIVGTTFNNLNKTVASAATLTMPAGSTETILGTLTLKGSSSSAKLTIVSSSPGTYWILDPRSTVSAEYVSVSDSQNLGATITACNSTDGGHNSGWSFNPASCTATGGSGSGEESSSTYRQANNGSDSSEAETTSSPFLETVEETVKNPSSIPTIQNLTKPKNKTWLLIILGIISGFIFLLIVIALIKKRHAAQTAATPTETVVAPGPKQPPQNLIM